MELSVEAGAVHELRRESVASWIQGNVRPVANVIENDTPVVDQHEAGQFEIREYQLDAWSNLWAARQSGSTSALVHLATGLGKTSIGVLDALKFAEEFKLANGREAKILFTCHKNEILEQAAERFKSFMPAATQGFFNGDTKNRNAQVTFATLQSLYTDLESFTPNDYDYIIDDEVHHTKADTFEKVIRYFKPAFRLGLTATPNRKDKKDIRELYGDEVYSVGLPEALANGWLAAPDYHIVFDDAVQEAIQSGFEATSLRALAELFNAQPRNKIIAKNIKEEMARIGLEFGEIKTIIFCQNIEHVEEMAELLDGKAYHSDTARDERRQIFNEFKNGELQVIATRDMFNEGVDVPDARLLVFLRSTSSQTIFEQQLGRGLRKHAGKNRVSVLDFVANIERIAMVKELADKVKGLAGESGRGSDSDGDDKESTDILINDSNAFGQGLSVHSGNANFDFDKMTIDLLKRWTDVKESATNKWSTLTNEDLITRALVLSPHKPLTRTTLSELSRDGEFISAPTVVKRFGSTRAFQEACGFKTESLFDLTNEDLVELALELSPDKPLNYPDFKTLNEEKKFIEGVLISRRFGSVKAFQEACGFKTESLFDLTNEDLVELALELSPDKPLGVAEIRSLSKSKLFVGHRSIIKRFSGMKAFHEACGFISTSINELSNDQLVDLAKKLSPNGPLNTPAIIELSKEGKFISKPTLVKRFGSTRAFQEACGWQ